MQILRDHKPKIGERGAVLICEHMLFMGRGILTSFWQEPFDAYGQMGDH